MRIRLPTGKIITIRRAILRGLTDGESIIIDSSIRPGSRLDLEIHLHEMIHNLWPDETEADTDAKARTLTRMLWKLGWRKK